MREQLGRKDNLSLRCERRPSPGRARSISRLLEATAGAQPTGGSSERRRAMRPRQEMGPRMTRQAAPRQRSRPRRPISYPHHPQRPKAKLPTTPIRIQKLPATARADARRQSIIPGADDSGTTAANDNQPPAELPATSQIRLNSSTSTEPRQAQSLSPRPSQRVATRPYCATLAARLGHPSSDRQTIGKAAAKVGVQDLLRECTRSFRVRIP